MKKFPVPRPLRRKATGSIGSRPRPATPPQPAAAGPAQQGVNGTGQLPWDAGYETQSGLINRNYQNQIAQLGQQETDTRSSFGFDPQYANNPLTRANLLQKSYQQGRLGATNNMAARGQLYSGATSNALGYQDFAHTQNENNLRNEYQGLLNKYSQGRISAAQSRDEGLASAKADALSRALEQDPEAIAPDVPDEGGPAGARRGMRKAARKRVPFHRVPASQVPRLSSAPRAGRRRR